MTKPNRRNMLRAGLAIAVLPNTALLNLRWAPFDGSPLATTSDSPDVPLSNHENATTLTDTENTMRIHYLEIVTKDVEATCKTFSQIHGVKFAEADQNLGGARTAELTNGGLLGVRAPLRETEEPVVRPYFLVEDIEASVETARDSGAVIALPPTEIAGHGQCAIIIQSGIQSGLWQK